MTVLVGHEATVAGVISNLRPEDALSPAAGDLVTCFLKGTSLNSILSLLSNADAAEPAALEGESGKELNLIPLAQNVLTTLSIATGAALAHKMQNNARVVVAFFGKEAGPMQGWRRRFISPPVIGSQLSMCCKSISAWPIAMSTRNWLPRYRGGR